MNGSDKMHFLNANAEETCIHHFQGKDRIMQVALTSEYNYVKSNMYPIEIPEDLTIVTFSTDDSKSILIEQLNDNNIPYINAAQYLEGPWEMPKKIGMIITALKSITTTYTLILDGYDVLVLSLKDIVEKFKSSRKHILFNATKNNYPNVSIDKIAFRDYIGSFKYLNAGCCIGYTEDLLCLYEMCQEFINNPNYENQFNSEQYVVRNIFKLFADNMLMNNAFVSFDFNCDIFLCLGNVNASTLDKEKHIFTCN